MVRTRSRSFRRLLLIALLLVALVLVWKAEKLPETLHRRRGAKGITADPGWRGAGKSQQA